MRKAILKPGSRACCTVMSLFCCKRVDDVFGLPIEGSEDRRQRRAVLSSHIITTNNTHYLVGLGVNWQDNNLAKTEAQVGKN